MNHSIHQVFSALCQLYAFDSSLSNNRLELSDNIILCYNEEKTEVFKCQKQVISF